MWIYETSLVAASSFGNLEIMQLLLDKAAIVKSQRGGIIDSALVAAGYSGKEEAVELLLAKGANMHAKVDGEWGSILIAALSSYSANKEFVQFLIDKGADVNAEVGGDWGSAIVAVAMSKHKKEYTELVELFLNNGADLNTVSMTRDYGYISPLVAAVQRLAMARRTGRLYDSDDSEDSEDSDDPHDQNLSSVRFLLERGANVNLEVDGKWRNALQAAGKDEKNEDLRQLLYEYGAVDELMSDLDE